MVDFSETLVLLISIIAPAVFVIGNKLAEWLTDWLKTKTPFGFLISETAVKETLQEAIQFGVDFAVVKAKESSARVEVDNAFLLNAIKYVKDSVPDALKRFNITDERLADMVRARIKNL
tara:strand:- start:5547 stop:5903 length:357 start_codon:yes stop_codon:yes gene_type:complete